MRPQKALSASPSRCSAFREMVINACGVPPVLRRSRAQYADMDAHHFSPVYNQLNNKINVKTVRTQAGFRAMPHARRTVSHPSAAPNDLRQTADPVRGRTQNCAAAGRVGGRFQFS